MRSQVMEKLKASAKRLATKLQNLSSPLSKTEGDLSVQESKIVLEKPLSLAYQVMGDKTARFMPLFQDLDLALQQSGLRINFKAYVSLTVLASLLITVAVAVVVPVLLFFVSNMSLSSALMFGFGGSLFTCAFTVIGFYLYPVYHADKHKRDLEDELPFTTGYMAILANAGVAPEKVFHSLANLNQPLAASTEAKEIVKNINLFGLDIISALEKASSRTPSEKFRDTLEGIISTIHTGGNLGGFLREKFKTAMKLKKLSLKKYSDSLSVLSEVYVALLLTGPLLLVIMVSVMSVLGGGGIGLLSPELLLSLLTYLLIPVCAVIFLIILDSTSPKW
ncbi:type II secretion system F family protein [Candidatus Bathyarchaeota archaeon]|nr:type II secretion system F family protein [Candidatus Bathyarchaeota archaeon]